MSGACHDCGSRRGETPFPPKRLPRTPLLCCDCMEERQRTTDRLQRPVLLTRAQWAARTRALARNPQADLVQWLEGRQG